MSKKAMKLALEVLKNTRECDAVSHAIKALEEALAQEQEQRSDSEHMGEPVTQHNICIECRNADSWGLPDKPICRECVRNSKWQPLNESSKNPLYTTPQPAPQGEARGLSQQKPWVGLTDEEIFETHKQVDSMQYLTFGKAIETKLKEKNT